MAITETEWSDAFEIVCRTARGTSASWPLGRLVCDGALVLQLSPLHVLVMDSGVCDRDCDYDYDYDYDYEHEHEHEHEHDWDGIWLRPGCAEGPARSCDDYNGTGIRGAGRKPDQTSHCNQPLADLCLAIHDPLDGRFWQQELGVATPRPQSPTLRMTSSKHQLALRHRTC